MDNYIAIVVDNDATAYDTLHALWALDASGDITVHGAAVVHRDSTGYVNVATKDTDPGVRTIIGIGIGAIIGALAGPAGAAAGAAAGSAVASAAGIGAAAGGLVGGTADIVKASEHEQAETETEFVLPRGESAVIAEVSEDWTMPVDQLAKRFNGSVYRRAKSDIHDDEWDWDSALYPYDYAPTYA